jgi:predicted esterase YcpF (UPF0227 family)
MSDAAIFPPKGSELGLHSLAREGAAFWDCVVRPPPFPAAPQGDRHTVLVIPGLLAHDWTTTRMRTFLRMADYRVETAHIRSNTGPTPRMLAKLDTTVLALSQDAPISIVGQSLGGVLARSLAMRHPTRIRHVVTLGSPIRFPVTTPLRAFAAMLAPFQDPAWLADRDHVSRSPAMPVTAIYSEEDGIVDWRQCLQDESAIHRNVRVEGAHMTMGSNPQVQIAMVEALISSS